MKRVPRVANNDKYLVSETVKDSIQNENAAVIVTNHRYHHFLGAPFQPNKDFLRQCRVSEQTIGEVCTQRNQFERNSISTLSAGHLLNKRNFFYDEDKAILISTKNLSLLFAFFIYVEL